MKKQTLHDALIMSLGAVIEGLPAKAQKRAARVAQQSLDAGLVSDPQTEQIIARIFLLDEPAA